jgi:hypothetical protein
MTEGTDDTSRRDADGSVRRQALLERRGFWIVVSGVLVAVFDTCLIVNAVRRFRGTETYWQEFKRGSGVGTDPYVNLVVALGLLIAWSASFYWYISRKRS